MRTRRVVLGNVLPDELPQFLRRPVFVDIKALTFQAAEPTLDHDVVRPAGFAVHTLLNAEIAKKLVENAENAGFRQLHRSTSEPRKAI